jgi:hypothetical protein
LKYNYFDSELTWKFVIYFIGAFKITQNGNGQIIVPSQLLVATGTYYYNLVINGHQVNSKKMLLVK